LSPAVPTDCWILPAGAAGGRAGVPLEPELAVPLNGAVMLAGGVALALGLSPRLVAGALAGSLWCRRRWRAISIGVWPTRRPGASSGDPQGPWK
jgi:hypothetical protein